MQGMTFVCRHLMTGRDAGFHWARNPEHPDDPCPPAWCDECEPIAKRGWPGSTARAVLKTICHGCYEVVRERNWRKDEDAYERLVQEALAFLEERQGEVLRRYRLLDYRYDWHPDTGRLVYLRDRQPQVVASTQMLGSVSMQSHTWLWSWANAACPEDIRGEVRRVRQYGERHRFLRLAAARWRATEADGWEMTAVSAFLLGAEAAKQVRDEQGPAFLVLTGIGWAQ